MNNQERALLIVGWSDPAFSVFVFLGGDGGGRY